MAYWITMGKALELWDVLNTGASIRQAARITGVNNNTVMRFRQRLLARADWRKREGLNEKANR